MIIIYTGFLRYKEGSEESEYAGLRKLATNELDKGKSEVPVTPSYVDPSLYSGIDYENGVMDMDGNPIVFPKENRWELPRSMCQGSESQKGCSCTNYTSYLKGITSDILKPYIVDVDVYYIHSSLVYYVILNTMHLDDYPHEQHAEYILLYLGKEYPNEMPKRNVDIGFSVLKFTVSDSKHYNEGDVVTFSLIDTLRHHPYDRIQACVRYPNPNPLPLAICAYVSNYNSVDELRFWISFYRVQKVSMVILYVTTPMPQLRTEFASLIQSGYLKLIDFTWPRHVKGWVIQCSNQQAQMNAAFYRFKYEVKAMIICDTDEFIYSEKYPFDLPAVRQYLEETCTNCDAAHVLIQFLLHVVWNEPIQEHRDDRRARSVFAQWNPIRCLPVPNGDERIGGKEDDASEQV